MLKTKAQEGVSCLLELLDPDPDREGLNDTPKRVVKAMIEMTRGYHEDPEKILSTQFDEKHDEVVILRDIPFSSLCEHHMLPFTGFATVGYLPGDKIVGLSKLARLVDCFARRLQVQERMTTQIATTLNDALSAGGVCVVIEATHACMSCRGVGKAGARMVTSCALGVFRTKPEARAEFMALARGS